MLFQGILQPCCRFYWAPHRWRYLRFTSLHATVSADYLSMSWHQRFTSPSLQHTLSQTPPHYIYPDLLPLLSPSLLYFFLTILLHHNTLLIIHASLLYFFLTIYLPYYASSSLYFFNTLLFQHYTSLLSNSPIQIHFSLNKLVFYIYIHLHHTSSTAHLSPSYNFPQSSEIKPDFP